MKHNDQSVEGKDAKSSRVPAPSRSAHEVFSQNPEDDEGDSDVDR